MLDFGHTLCFEITPDAVCVWERERDTECVRVCANCVSMCKHMHVCVHVSVCMYEYV